MPTDLVPKQEKGKSIDLVETVRTTDNEAAKKLLTDGIYLLCRPALWHDETGTLSASFSVDCKQEEQAIEKGDYIKISIPGPGLSEGEGGDWVRVEAVDTNFDDEQDESFGIQLRVCADPHTKGEAIAHFFAEGASSTFILARKGKTVTAHYMGRNETPNFEDLKLMDKVRNMVVAGGAIAGISELQWKALLKALLADGK